MKLLLALIAAPALTQNTANPQNNLPGVRNSGAGVPGQAGNKNGPAAGPHGQTVDSDKTNQATRLQDSSGIPGKPGGKSALGPEGVGMSIAMDGHLHLQRWKHRDSAFALIVATV